MAGYCEYGNKTFSSKGDGDYFLCSVATINFSEKILLLGVRYHYIVNECI